MTTYSHTVSFQDIERIAIESIVNDAINKFKLEHPDGTPVPWVLESIIEKFKQSDMRLLSSLDYSNNAGDGQ